MDEDDRVDREATFEGPGGDVVRRTFLRTGAGALVGAAAAGPACAGLGRTARPRKTPRPLTERQMTAYTARLDRGLAEISQGSLARRLAPAGEADVAGWAAELAGQDRLARQAMRALYFTGMYNDLPEASRQHPEMQKRLRAQLPELDEALFSTTAYLGSLGKDELAEVQQTLRHDPTLGRKITRLLNGDAKRVGVSAFRRQQVHAMVDHATWRMRAQPPSLLVDEYVEKVQRVAAKHGQTEQLKRYLANTIGDAAFWKHQHHLASVAATPITVPPPAPAARTAPPPPAPRRRAALEPEARPKGHEPGSTLVTAGAVLLGIAGGLGLVGVGAWFGHWLAGAIIWTVGGIALIVGLIVLIIGLVRRSRARAQAKRG